MSDQSFVDSSPIAKISAAGLNLIAVFDLASLPLEIKESLGQQNIPLNHFKRLVLLGNGGHPFWDALNRFGTDRPDPIDTFSRHLANQLIHEISAEDDQNLLLYPQTDYLVPLQQLGTLAGWGGASPIGNSIHPEYGLWFAFRVAFLTSIELPMIQADSLPSPCDSCVSKPCQSACPAGAVHNASHEFGLNGCIAHRLAPGSSCALTCLARLACPIGKEHQYPPDAIKRLYTTSIDGIRKWQVKNGEQIE